MSYLSKKKVLSGISERIRNRNGKEVTVYDAYLGYDPFTRKQKRLSSADLKDLKKKINEFYANYSSGGEIAVRLNAVEATDALEAISLLRQHNLSISLTNAVQRLLEGNMVNVCQPIGIGEAFERYMQTFDPRQDMQITAVKNRVGRWVQIFGSDRMISEVTPGEICEWLEKSFHNNKTYNNNLCYIRTFLNWCCAKSQNWLSENPISDMPAKPIAWREPKYMKPGDVEKMFRILDGNKGKYPDRLAYAVLSFFCGIRRAEILRMGEDASASRIDLEDETIRIVLPKGWTRGIAPRAFQILPNALAWMRSFPFREGLAKITQETPSRLIDMVRAHGLEYPKNAGRHTFITMSVAAYQNPEATAASAGTSLAMLVKNYKGLASKKDGVAYFSIMP